MELLIDDVLYKILDSTTYRDLLKMESVSKHFKKFINVNPSLFHFKRPRLFLRYPIYNPVQIVNFVTDPMNNDPTIMNILYADAGIKIIRPRFQDL